MNPGELICCAALGLVAAIASGPRLPRVWLALTLASALATLCAALAVLGGAPDWEWRSAFAVGGQTLHLRLDGISALFLVLTSAVGGAGAVYSHEYWSDADHPGAAPRSRMWWSAILLCMDSLLLSSNGIHFLVSWELFALCAYFLITLDTGRREVREAGWLYFASSHAGTLALFAFFAGLAALSGSWDLGPMRGAAHLAPLYWLALAGFAVKAGFFPVHIWLPSAHANAPSHVSALMSGVAIKMGIYGLVRFSGWIPTPPAAPWILIGVGATSAVLGIGFALAQNDYKRLLAYCSVENVGLISIGLGGALLGLAHPDAVWGRLLLAGALLHVLNHGLFKSLLFLGAGSIVHATGTREMSRLGGMWRRMPWTAALFAAGALAASGLPPFNGFVGEWLVYMGLFDAAASRTAAVWATIPAAIALAAAGALALASFTKAGAVMFLGAPRTRAAEQAHECGPWMRTPMVFLAGASLAIGLAPMLIWPALQRAVVAWNPGWSSQRAPAPFLELGITQLAIGASIVTAATLLWRRTRANGMRRELTWDCGFREPTARMQYSSGSFAAVAGGWFAWIVRIERSQRRPRGLFPERAERIERVPETVLVSVIEPAGRVMLRLAGIARRLQHGRLQFYILYLLSGLVLLAVLAASGGPG